MEAAETAARSLARERDERLNSESSENEGLIAELQKVRALAEARKAIIGRLEQEKKAWKKSVAEFQQRLLENVQQRQQQAQQQEQQQQEQKERNHSVEQSSPLAPATPRARAEALREATDALRAVAAGPTPAVLKSRSAGVAAAQTPATALVASRMLKDVEGLLKTPGTTGTTAPRNDGDSPASAPQAALDFGTPARGSTSADAAKSAVKSVRFSSKAAARVGEGNEDVGGSGMDGARAKLSFENGEASMPVKARQADAATLTVALRLGEECEALREKVKALETLLKAHEQRLRESTVKDRGEEEKRPEHSSSSGAKISSSADLAQAEELSTALMRADSAESALSALQARLDAAESQVSEVTNAQESSAATIERLRTELSARDKVIEALKAAVTEHVARAAQLEQETHDCRSRAAAHEARADALATQLEVAQNQQQRAQEDLRSAQDEAWRMKMRAEAQLQVHQQHLETQAQSQPASNAASSSGSALHAAARLRDALERVARESEQGQRTQGSRLGQVGRTEDS